ncbi:unnamed protein product [Rhizoctonia solani]|uniref:Protein kinase domain-containing protein n=1 Tax=Rhizoctonia solani TaxID=456999 RepID=A0A8H3HTZ6_9AGAM|nr:unnamed protein product [Rhizoctonia solani]
MATAEGVINIFSTPEHRSEAEERWVSFQPYLLSKGYRLRARYQPDWVPSWKEDDVDALDCEDSVDCRPVRVIDAVRIEDGRRVMIKMIIRPQQGRKGLKELELLRHFSTAPIKDDPSNHVVPCLDSFPIPDADGCFVVMPLLGRYKYPSFFNFAEVHDFLQQIFEASWGLIFLHNHSVAHCDIASNNIMMDASTLYTEPIHPFHYQFSFDMRRRLHPKYIRSQVRIRYYYIDLGYAKWFKEPSAGQKVLADPARLMAPEQIPGSPYDPFLGDVFQLGAVIRRDLSQEVPGLRFLEPLTRKMTYPEPSKRPLLKEAQASMNTAFLGLSGWTYRRPFIPKGSRFKDYYRLVLIGVLAELEYWMKRFLNLLKLV